MALPRNQPSTEESLEKFSQLEALPSSEDAEKILLSLAALDPARYVPEFQTRLPSVDVFYTPAYRTIWETLVQMVAGSKPVDLATLCAVLRDNQLLDKVGGPGAIAEFFSAYPNAQNVEFYLQIVRDKWLLRELIKASTQNIQEAMAHQVETSGREIGSILGQAEERTFAVMASLLNGEDNPNRKVIDSDQMSDHWTTHFDTCMKQRGKISGMQLGFPTLDRTFGGFGIDPEGDMLAICAEPGMGKSALAITLVENLGIEQKYPGMVFPLEMGRIGYWDRLICGRAGVNTNVMRNGFVSRADQDNIGDALQDAQISPILWDNSAFIEIADLRAKVQVAKRQKDIKWVLIDHFGQLRPSSKQGKDNDLKGQQEIMEGLHSIRRDLGIFVIILYQLNKEGTKRLIKQLYTFSDIKGATEKTEYPTHIVFLSRPCSAIPWLKLSDEQRESWDNQTSNLRRDNPTCWAQHGQDRWLPDELDITFRDYMEHARIQVAKNRHGATPDNVPIRFIPEIQRFRDRVTKLYSNNPNDRQPVIHGF